MLKSVIASCIVLVACATPPILQPSGEGCGGEELAEMCGSRCCLRSAYEQCNLVLQKCERAQIGPTPDVPMLSRDAGNE